MSAFRYEAIDGAGKTRKGVLEADSARAGRNQLRTQGLTPLVVELAASRLHGERSQRLALGRKLSQREQAILTRQLASLLIAGLPLDESLSVLSEQAEREYVRELMASIRAEVVGGHTFANALTQHPRDFPEIYRALVAAGEHTGKLGVVLSRLADYIEQSNALKQKILLAFTYPGIVTLIAFGIVTFLLSYVVPQVANVFTSTKQQLPFLTVAMMALSDFVRHWWWASLVAFAAAVLAIRKVLSQARPRLAFDRWTLTAPLAGKLVRGYNTVRFASTLGILTAAGVPILRALQAAGETLSNRAMRANIDDAIVRVREGSALSRALNHVKTFPPVLVHLIRSGEATGDVTTMLDRAAEGEARELERRTMFLTSLLEPLLILAMGGVVLVIVLAVMMPIIELNNMVQ
ncbi:type II secretion system inner membrane protein GspF [Burkholderia stagnalis]|uniref:type II secretion system inner membrane protein GspF n=1 Tax=Burkholderia stagnalis TaxID=1503054 RepID=UPI00075C422C|nr:type II secretion system inner membrane protein GspF [Burkholderia stagnalis]KVC61404.1 type II secretion system protein GspF [Burkholderia stagnalis]KVN20328.1 type II secretion system protein GspF [Burkholderia stagnalis]KVN62351.1 type II secretion system protein GspF [Burkholderia stagnalis]KWI71644.1 type II secretion system protein GspF [Burkholderia stagnalis]KWK72683.1 type II secretion system protein GspF [Burkholderia stagnalis]